MPGDIRGLAGVSIRRQLGHILDPDLDPGDALFPIDYIGEV
jgi:hypothetical protein